MKATILKTVEQNFRSNRHGDTTLRYTHNSNGHIVRRVMPGGWEDQPTVYRLATVEEARKTWKRLQDQIIAEGYTRRSN